MDIRERNKDDISEIMKTTQQLDEYIISYINNRWIMTEDNDDYVLSCNIRHDLNVSYQAILSFKKKNTKTNIEGFDALYRY